MIALHKDRGDAQEPGGPFNERYWKLYRDERKKLVKGADPKCKRPFQVTLTAQQIAHVARTARKRWNGPRPEGADA